jgi:hypothetical protein
MQAQGRLQQGQSVPFSENSNCARMKQHASYEKDRAAAMWTKFESRREHRCIIPKPGSDNSRNRLGQKELKGKIQNLRVSSALQP